MKQLFQGYTIIAWHGTNFSTNKFTDYNRVILKHYMNYYIKYWHHRNKAVHNLNVQKQRIIELY